MRESIGFFVPEDIFFCFLDRRKESADGLIEGALFDEKKLCDGIGIRKIAGESVAGFGGVSDRAAVLKDSHSLMYRCR